MRISTSSSFGRVLLGLQRNQLASLRAQEQLSSGKRILRPSDDPAGTGRALTLRRELSRTQRIQDAVATGRTQLELASSTLQQGSELLTRARELMVQAMNGTLNDDDRATIAAELREIRKQLLDEANLQVDGNHVFGGTRLGGKPWIEVSAGGQTRVVYQGNSSEQLVQAGADTLIGITLPGDQVFGRAVPGATRYDGLSGVRAGSTADEGSGYAYLSLRHDASEADAAVLGAGVALVNGGADDSLLGANALVIDATAGTVRLGDGTVVAIPEAGERGDVLVRNAQGGELHLDLSAWNGLDVAGTVTGQGSIALGDSDFVALDFAETDLELADGAGRVVHVDTTGVLRAGRELATFGETLNPFDLLQGVVEDLENDDGLAPSELNTRLNQRLGDLDRVHEDLLLGLGTLGSRAARLVDAGTRQEEIELNVAGRLSEVENVDLSQAAMDLARSDMILQVAQAAGARVMQTSLLDFLG